MKTLTIILLLITAQVTAQDTTYNFTAKQVKTMNLVIEELKFKRMEVDSLTSLVFIKKKEIVKLDLIIAMQDTIIGNKEQQIIDLEKKPVNVTTVSNVKWHTWVFVILGSIGAGMVLDRVVLK